MISPAEQILTDSLLVLLYVKRDWSLQRIAGRYGCCKETIRKRLLRLGVERRKPERLEIDLTAALAALAKRRPLWEIAEDLEVSEQTLRRRLAEAGHYPLPYGGLGRRPKALARRAYDRGAEVEG
jgi:transposase-like protein